MPPRSRPRLPIEGCELGEVVTRYVQHAIALVLIKGLRAPCGGVAGVPIEESRGPCDAIGEIWIEDSYRRRCGP